MKQLYHVCSAKKLAKYKHTGFIKPPVRAWRTIEKAEKFSKQTGRHVIIRLKYNPSFKPLFGHEGLAVVSANPYEVYAV